MSSGLKLAQFSCRSLQSVNFTLNFGECVGLTGPSGGGKSLFLRALADLDPYQGSMSLDGVEAEQLPAPQWRRQVGLLPAESAWWFDTVGEHFSRLPDGWLPQLGFQDQVLTWQVGQLSSGERQRLSLLRLLVQYPRILLLDEPTANLDTKNTTRVECLIKDYRSAHKPGIIWISHDIEQLKRTCNALYVLEDQQLNQADSSSDDRLVATGEELS